MTPTPIGIAEIRRYFETRNYEVPSVEQCEVFLEALAETRLFVPYVQHIHATSKAGELAVEDMVQNFEHDSFDRGWKTGYDEGYEHALDDLKTLDNDPISPAA